MKGVTILGATGSIGDSTLDILARHPEEYRLHALVAHKNHQKMITLAKRYKPDVVYMSDPAAAKQVEAALPDGYCVVSSDPEKLTELVSTDAVDIVVAAIVGAAGLIPSLAAVRAGKRVLLANKEALVMSGEIFMQEVKASGAELLPVDSEHNAIFQCLPCDERARPDMRSVSRVFLTGSGGPFRDMAIDELADVSPDQALAHPTWDMGPKISIDSATMMNKGLEMIEACWLFGLTPDQIQITLHRQSIIHSLVAFSDGSVLAQLGNPDMRTPIANALAWPERIQSGVEPLDLIEVSRLDFGAADLVRYPCLRLTEQAWYSGGTAPAILNAANEIAVEKFLEGGIRFTHIPMIVEETLNTVAQTPADDLAAVLAADAEARQTAVELAGRV